jgi:hypothetical protein
MNRLQLYAARGRFVSVSDRNGSVGRRLEEEVEEVLMGRQMNITGSKTKTNPPK